MSQFPSITPEFKDFIISLLKVGKLKEERIRDFTDEESMIIFRTSFIHRSYGSEENYELNEFLGDVVVNNCIAFYLRRRFPRVVSVKYLTRLKHNLVSQKSLASIAKNFGFLNNILYGKNVEDIVKQSEFSATADEYVNAMLEDTLEAFIGALVSIIDEKTRIGVGYSVAYNIISSYLNQLNVSLNYEDIFDPKSRIKELYDRLRWDFDRQIKTFKLKSAGKNEAQDVWKCQIYGYPYGDRKRTDENRTQISYGIGSTKTEAQNKASLLALSILAKKYNIFENPPDPYKKN